METKTRRRRDDRATVILDAAGAVLRQGGARGLTIDAVAAQAGLSKGGVLHHYASKDALILALVSRELAALRDGIAACEAEQRGTGPADLALAMVAHLRRSYCGEEKFSRALLLASFENPEALAGYRAFVDERLARLGAADAPPGSGSAVFFAILGLMIGRTLGFHDLRGLEAEALFQALEGAARCLGGPADGERAPIPADRTRRPGTSVV